MNMRNGALLLLIPLSLSVLMCKTDTKWKGQEPIKKVSTKTRPIEYQLKKIWSLGNGIYSSNKFEGARLNGAVLTDDTLLTVLINPENTPINSSPWYSFQLWADTVKNITLKITYLEGNGHRYYPKISHDGKNWLPIDSTLYRIDTFRVSDEELPPFCKIKLALDRDTTWISAQELITSKQIYKWTSVIAEKSFASMQKIGESAEGRPIHLLQIGNPESKNLIMILSRQHPPEVSGWLAMKAFVETICEENPSASKFRNNYLVCVVPLANPDGVDNGHWRSNAHGIDLNRDWEDFNQPETKVIKDFAESRVAAGSKFYCFIDFHSTQHDIYYTIAPELKGNMPGLVPEIINAVGKEIPGYDPNIRPNDVNEPKISSTGFFFHQLGAEAVTFEIGDETSRGFIQKKGSLTAIKLMEMMNLKIN